MNVNVGKNFMDVRVLENIKLIIYNMLINITPLRFN
jgi:hypothetical protein